MSNTQESVRVSSKLSVDKVACRAYLDFNQSDLLDNNWNKITFNRVSYDLGLNFSTTNYRLTIPVSGLYNINSGITLDGASVVANKRYSLGVYKNGSLIKKNSNHSSLADDLTLEIKDERYLKKNDYLEIYIYPSSIGSDTVDIQGDKNGKVSYFIVRLITKEGIRQ